MFDMAGVTTTAAAHSTITLLNNLSSSPSGASNTMIKMSSSPCQSTTLSPTMSPTVTTPNHEHHQQQQHHFQHNQNHTQHHNHNHMNNNNNNITGNNNMSTTIPSHIIKKEIGLLSSPGSGNENLHNSGNGGPAEVFNSKCKRKINFSHLGIPPRGHQPATVARRNARERNRVKQVNNGFAALKQHIPLGHRSKKMSKVETLRCAVDYIKNLKTLLDPNDASGLSGDSFDALQNYQFDFGVSSGSGSTHQLSPTSSDDPSSPSYASDGPTSNGAPTALYDYENYEPVSPEDEELLEAISWWQQS